MSEYRRYSRESSDTCFIIEPEISHHRNSRLQDPVLPHRYNTRSSVRHFTENNQNLTSRSDDPDDTGMSLRTGVNDVPTHLNPCCEPNYLTVLGRFTKYGLLCMMICAVGILCQNSLLKPNKTVDLEGDLVGMKSLMGEMKTNMQSILKARDETSKVLDDIHQLFHRLESREMEFEMKCSQPMDEVNEKGGRGGAAVQEVQDAIQTALDKYDADKTGMADFALESAGAEILGTPNTKNYNSDDSVTLLGWKLCSSTRGPSVILQPGVMPGQCWAFCGSCGSVVIRLMAEIKVSAVTLEHIPKEISPSNDISSAPKDFVVYGVDNHLEKTKLGKFTYDSKGSQIQTFKVVAEKNTASFSIIRIDFLSNHGNPHYTCVYRVRVHGVIKGSTSRAIVN